MKYADYLLSNGATANGLFFGRDQDVDLLQRQVGQEREVQPAGLRGRGSVGELRDVRPNATNKRCHQGAASCHNNAHKDYSQILQLMKNFKIYGHDFDLGAALVTAHPGVWGYPNEGLPYAPTKIDKLYCPFDPAFAATLYDPATVSALKGTWKVQYRDRDEETYVFKQSDYKEQIVTWSNASGGKARATGSNARTRSSFPGRKPAPSSSGHPRATRGRSSSITPFQAWRRRSSGQWLIRHFANR